jgi:ribonuclease M5
MKENNEVVVVEGYHDLAKLRSIYPQIDIVITNGSEISKETLNELKILNSLRGLILFLDPDYQGERIRRMINDYVGDTKHAFLPKEKCISKNKKKVGIEHAKKDDIMKALKNIMTTNITHNSKNKIEIKDLYNLKLTGCKNAKSNRKKLTENIGIGLSNGKTLLRKLNMFAITKEEIIQVLKR